MVIKKFLHVKHLEMDLTKGNLFWKFALFALPLALTTILQLLKENIDMWKTELQEQEDEGEGEKDE